jgi:Ca-activated chloride channel family protein
MAIRLNSTTISTVVAILVAASAADAQTAPSHTLKVQAKLVEVSAIVRSKSGAPVTGVTHGDFALKEDGKLQQIVFFSQGSELPLTLALMVDTSGSEHDYVDEEIAAARDFFPAVLKKPEDRAVLVQFDERVRQLARITNSIPVLENALAYLSESHPSATHLYDAISAVSEIELSNQVGRKAMVILTDGGDLGSQSNMEQAAEKALRADVMIYSVYYGRGQGNAQVLNYLSEVTGGRTFAVSAKTPLEQVYAEIANDMSLLYELGYTPPDPRPNRYHKVELKTTDKNLLVQAREGYYTPK